ncbi:MAG: hypothetical protein LBB88_09455 [Planctomycetaceae bacterium]|jgi:hypothetical protein|nr:hypothetical protein [Planctomycetaceae bacterium]
MINYSFTKDFEINFTHPRFQGVGFFSCERLQNNYIDEIDLEISGTLCQEQCSNSPNIIVNNSIHNNADPRVILDILKNLLPEKY